METQPSPARRPGGHLLVVAAGTAIVAMILCWLVGAILTHSYVVLLPDRLNDEADVGLVTGAVALVVTVTTLLRYRPNLNGSPFIGVPALGFCALLLGFLLGMGSSSELFELYDFSRSPLVTFDGDLRVSRFFKSHGKGTHYHVALTDFGPDLDLYYDDYRWNAGDRERFAVSGKCIRTRLERSGRALRMIQPEHVHAVPCPADPKLLQLG